VEAWSGTGRGCVLSWSWIFVRLVLLQVRDVRQGCSIDGGRGLGSGLRRLVTIFVPSVCPLGQLPIKLVQTQFRPILQYLSRLDLFDQSRFLQGQFFLPFGDRQSFFLFTNGHFQPVTLVWKNWREVLCQCNRFFVDYGSIWSLLWLECYLQLTSIHRTIESVQRFRLKIMFPLLWLFLLSR